MARLLEVKSKIELDDVFYTSRLAEVTNSLPGEEIKDYIDFSFTGADLQRFVLSFQSNFLDVVEVDIVDLSDKFNTMLSDFVDVKLIHTSHYEEQTNKIAESKSQIDINRDLNNKNYEVYSYLNTHVSRLTRLYHVVPDTIRTEAIPDGGIQLLCESGDDLKYPNVNTLRVNNTDISNRESLFWGVFPGDILEIVGQIVLPPDDEDYKIENEIFYRVIYTINSTWDPFTQDGQSVFDIPVTWRGGNFDDIQLSFEGDDVPSDLNGNVVDYVYGQFSVFPCIDLERYQTLLKVYNDYLVNSPIGMVIPWFELSKYKTDSWKQEYGVYEEVPNMGGRYLIGAGGLWASHGSPTSYSTHTTSKPKSNNSNKTDTKGEHNHSNTLNLSEDGQHRHSLGHATQSFTGTGTKLQSAQAWDNPATDPHKIRIEPPIYDGNINTHTHVCTLSTQSSHTHSFDNKWDTYNRMYSVSCIWIEKKEHPTHIKLMRERLVVLYGEDFDK